MGLVGEQWQSQERQKEEHNCSAAGAAVVVGRVRARDYNPGLVAEGCVVAAEAEVDSAYALAVAAGIRARARHA